MFGTMRRQAHTNGYAVDVLAILAGLCIGLALFSVALSMPATAAGNAVLDGFYAVASLSGTH